MELHSWSIDQFTLPARGFDGHIEYSFSDLIKSVTRRVVKYNANEIRSTQQKWIPFYFSYNDS